MAVQSIRPPLDKILTLARAWFPAPEFRTEISNNLQNFCTMLCIVHRSSAWQLTQMIDDRMLDELNYDALTEQIMVPIAHRLHMELACLGHGDPYHTSGFFDSSNVPWTRHDPIDAHDDKQALLQLMGLRLLERDAQGIGKVLYMVRPKIWARLIHPSLLDEPLEWWQGFVSKVLAEEAKRK